MSIPIGRISVVFFQLFGTMLRILESWIWNHFFQIECWKYLYGVFEKINSEDKIFLSIKLIYFSKKSKISFFFFPPKGNEFKPLHFLLSSLGNNFMTNVIKITQINFKNSLPLKQKAKQNCCLTWICGSFSLSLWLSNKTSINWAESVSVYCCWFSKVPALLSLKFWGLLCSRWPSKGWHMVKLCCPISTCLKVCL